MIQRIFRLISGLIAVGVILVLGFMAYITWTPKLIGLESAVGDVCLAVEAGMNSAEVASYVGAQPNFNYVDALDFDEAYINKQQGEFVCMCRVNFANEQVEMVEEPFCVD